MSLSITYILYFIIILLIYTSKDTLLFGTNINKILVVVGYIVPALCVCILLFLKSKQNKCISYPTYKLGIAFYMSILVLVTLFINVDLSVKYIYQITLILCSLVCTTTISYKDFRTIFNNTIFIIAVASIFSCVLYYVLYNTLNIFPTVYNTNNIPYYCTALSVIPFKAPYEIYRSYGIFREPGVYIIYLNLSIIFELFSNNKVRYFRLSVLIVALLTTMSTAGYVVFILVLLSFLLTANKQYRKSKIIIFSIISIFCVIVVSYLGVSFFYGIIINKFINGGASSDARFDSIIINLYLLLDKSLSFIFGLGFDYVEANFSIKALEVGSLAGIHNTNTFFKMLSVNGLLFVVLYLTSLAIFWIKYYKKQWFILLLAFCMLLSNEDMMFNILTYIIPFYAYNNGVRNMVYSSVKKDYQNE